MMGAEALITELMDSHELSLLELSHSALKPSISSSLAHLVSVAPNLKHLDLGWNRLGSDGASHVLNSTVETT